MPLEDMAVDLGKMAVKRVFLAWSQQRERRAERDQELIDLIPLTMGDYLQRRKLARRLDDLADHVASRVREFYENEFSSVPESDREAAGLEVSSALQAADLSDIALFAADMRPREIARSVRDRAAKRRSLQTLSPDARSLFDRLLDDSCLLIVQIAQQLPQYTPRIQTAMLARLGDVESKLADLAARLPKISLDAPGGEQNDWEFRQVYFEHISTMLDELEIFGIDTRNFKPRTLVSTAYLSLQVQRQKEDFSSRRHIPRDTRTENVSIETALGANEKTLIRGDAGSGKTTLLQWLAVNCVRSTFRGTLRQQNGTTPLFVKLRSFGDAPLPSLDNLIKDAYPALSDIVPNGWVHRTLKSGQGFLLVDGVDEIPQERRNEVRNWLRGLVAAYDSLRVVVTSRPAAAEKNWLAELGFASSDIEPMSARDVEVFCERWHLAIEDACRRGALTLGCAIEELPSYLRSLLQHIEARDDLRKLATNPLMCAMMCALNLDRRTNIPPSRMNVYEEAMSLLLDRRDTERRIKHDNLLPDKTSKVVVLQHLAWALSQANRSEIRTASAIGHISLAVARLPEFSSTPEHALTFLLERSGIIREPTPGRIDFVHRTFQEYLAAKHACDTHQIDLLLTLATRDQWREIIVMAAGHATDVLRDDLLRGLLEKSETDKRHRRRLRLLCAACLDTAGSVAPDLVSDIEDSVSELYPPRQSTESRSLASIGNITIERLPRELSTLTASVSDACVQTAGYVSGPRALELLRLYTEDARPSIQHAIQKVWRFFDPEVYASTVLADAPLMNGRVSLESAGNVKHLHYLKHLSSVDISLVRSEVVKDLNFLKDVANLRFLSFQALSPVSLAPIAQHRGLRALTMLSEAPFSDVEALGELDELQRLTIDGLSADLVAHVLAQSESRTKLRTLRAQRYEGSSLAAFAPLTDLRELQLVDAPSVRDVSALEANEKLASLMLVGAPLKRGAEAVRPLLKNLQTLNLHEIPTLRTLEALREPSTRLRRLWIRDCPVDDLEAVYSIPSLQDVVLIGTPQPDLARLASLPRINRIDLRGSGRSFDLDVIPETTTLRTLWLSPHQETTGQHSRVSVYRL